MLWESAPWKNALRSDVLKLLHLKRHNGDETRLDTIERILFTSVFTVRKVMESKKITDACARSSLPIISYSSKGEGVPDHLNWHKLDKFYDLSKPQRSSCKLKPFCNMMMHSFAFVLQDRPAGVLDSIIISSDRERGSRVLEIAYADVLTAFARVADDVVGQSAWHRDENGQWRITNS